MTNALALGSFLPLLLLFCVGCGNRKGAAPVPSETVVNRIFNNQLTNRWEQIEIAENSTTSPLARDVLQYFSFHTTGTQAVPELESWCKRAKEARVIAYYASEFRPKDWPARGVGPPWWRPSEEAQGLFFQVSTNISGRHYTLSVFAAPRATNAAIFSHVLVASRQNDTEGVSE